MWKLVSGHPDTTNRQTDESDKLFSWMRWIGQLLRTSTYYVSLVVATHKLFGYPERMGSPLKKRSIGFVTWTVFYRDIFLSYCLFIDFLIKSAYLCVRSPNHVYMSCVHLLGLFKHVHIQHFALLFIRLLCPRTPPSHRGIHFAVLYDFDGRKGWRSVTSPEVSNTIQWCPEWKGYIQSRATDTIRPTHGIGSITSSYLFGRWMFSSQYSLPSC